MTVETVNYISDLDKTLPPGSDPKSEGATHLRNIKKALTQSFANVSGAVTTSDTELNYVAGVTSGIQAQLNALAPAMTFVSSQVASASSYIEFTGLASGYDYVLMADGIQLSADSDVQCRVLNSGSPDTGSNYDQAHNYYSYTGTGIAGGINSAIALWYVMLGVKASSTARASLKLEVVNPASTTNARAVYGSAAYLESNAGYPQQTNGVYLYRSTTAVDGIRVFPQVGTFTAGTFNLYKIKRS